MAFSLLSVAAVAQESAPAAQRCRARTSVSACDDAIRWNPSDPSLLVAMGDTLMKARRPADAVRAYQRAATLVPNMPGIAAKIEAAQAAAAKLKSRSTAGDASSSPAVGRRFSNSEPDTQTH